MQTIDTVAVMNKLNSTVELTVGKEPICLHLTMLTLSSTFLDISAEQLRFIIDCNEGKLVGLYFHVKFKCNDDRLEMHSKVYRAKCAASFRLSANKYSLKFVFVDLDYSQSREIRRTIAKIC